MKRVGNIDRIYVLISCTKRVVAIFIDVNRSLITDLFESYVVISLTRKLVCFPKGG